MRHYMCSAKDAHNSPYPEAFNTIKDPHDSDHLWYWMDYQELYYHYEIKIGKPIVDCTDFAAEGLNGDGFTLTIERMKVFMVIQKFSTVITVGDNEAFNSTCDPTKFVELTGGDWLQAVGLYVHEL